MSGNVFLTMSLADLKSAATWLLSKAEAYNYLAFYGELGAGKTTLIQEMCRQSGVRQEVTSPTFALVNEYTGSDEQVIYHFDFYRIDEPEEVLDIGFEDYISSGNRCFMEWPEKIEPFLPDNTLRVFINVQNNKARLLRIDFPS
jgi:tRNA threonylcarbamoyladenosine biosynthesis protein TsaE